MGQNDQEGDHETSDEPSSKRLKTDNGTHENGALGSDVKFDWNADLSDLKVSALDDNEGDEQAKEKSFAKSDRISTPVSNQQQQRTQEQFEDLVKKASNDSKLWIDYIQFYIDQAEIDRARAVAERALVNIFYR